MPTRAEEYISKQITIPTVEYTLPSGFLVLLRRPAIQQWAMAGCLPPYFSADVREAWKLAQVSDPEAATGEQRRAWVFAFREMVKWACVSPRLVENGDPEKDELDPTYLSAEDQQAIWDFIAKGSPGIPVPTTAIKEGGNAMHINVNDVQQFRNFQ
jgi:hypothetical protein